MPLIIADESQDIQRSGTSYEQQATTRHGVFSRRWYLFMYSFFEIFIVSGRTVFYSITKLCRAKKVMDSSRNTPHRKMPSVRKTYFALFAILGITLLFFVLTLILQGNQSSILSNPIRWFSEIDPELALSIISTAAELLAAVLAIAITVVAIIVELAANRYSHRISSLFVKEPINILVMSFFVVATLYCIWVAFTLDAGVADPIISNAGLFASLVFLSVSLVILLPYFAFVMSFLSPVSVIGKIQGTALDAIMNISKKTTADSQEKFITAVDELQDIARRSAELGDRAVEMASINAMFELVLSYQPMIAGLRQHAANWFDVSEVVRNDPDFVSVNETSLANIRSQKTWAEVKILRQYLDLVGDSRPGSRDASYLIAINSRRMAIECLEYRPNLELTHLCMRCFNSYLRATINKKDARTGYYIMNHYRMLGEELLARRELDAANKVANYIHFYGLLGFQQGLPFLLEVAAEDVAKLASNCIQGDDKLLDDLLDLVLNLDQELNEEFQSDSLLGVRRAQIKLAAYLLESGDEERATRICADLQQEKPERLNKLFNTLKTEHQREYWEFTDRGVNYAYLPDNLKAHLDTLAGKINRKSDFH